ncbi:MAG: DUF3667 domain-containing protein [Lysobacterales bacterium]|jgi:uncharacterized membrane protein
MSQEINEATQKTATEATPVSAREQLPATVPDSKLTIRKTRLIGSSACLNCGTELKGPFCHYCGQPDKNLMRFFPVLLREMLEDFVDFDSRFMRTMKPLLFRPGKLTRDYLDGRRFRYVPPLRLYLFSSILMFFLAAILANTGINLATQSDTDGAPIQISMSESEQADLDQAMQELDKVQPGLGETVGAQIEAAQSDSQDKEDEEPEINFDVDGKPWDPVSNPVVVPLMPDFVNRWVNRELEESPQKLKGLRDDPGVIIDKAFDVLPGTMFILLPLVAILLKFWYLFARRYYVEHLIFALHNHAFIFVSLLIMMLVSVIAHWTEPAGDGLVTSVTNFIKTALMIWIPVYLLISLRRVYQQGWWLTTVKFSAIGLSYVFLLSFATAFVALLSIVLL